ncbi:Cd(II)/Pb(II)-responsive transcriptional regulator [compost metagenome]
MQARLLQNTRLSRTLPTITLLQTAPNVVVFVAAVSSLNARVLPCASRANRHCHWGRPYSLSTLRRILRPWACFFMKIGELAKLTQTQAETIRFYEREGLINEPPRTDGNYRLYGLEHLARLGFIRSCRSLDMTLAEIRTLLQFKDAPEENCKQVNALLDEHIGHAATRIKELKILQKDLKALREQCTTDRIASECGILNHLE